MAELSKLTVQPLVLCGQFTDPFREVGRLHLIQLSTELTLQGLLEITDLAAKPLVVGPKNFKIGARTHSTARRPGFVASDCGAGLLGACGFDVLADARGVDEPCRDARCLGDRG